MGNNNRQIGTNYEQKAGEYLESIGFEILQYNYRCRMGEIDIIAVDGEYLVFCEVKYRRDNKKGYPAEAVDQKKQRVISRCAVHYLTMHRLHGQPCRFDVVSILGEVFTHIEDAFNYIG